MPAVAPFVRAYEAVTRRTFPALKPQRALVSPAHLLHGQSPDFRDRRRRHRHALLHPRARLRAGARLRARAPLLDATPHEAEAAIGGFVVLNDFQRPRRAARRDALRLRPAEGQALPQRHLERRRHRRRGPAALARAQGLACASTASSSPSRPPPTRAGRWARSRPRVSVGEQLYPGELFGTGTLPGGSGIETRPPARAPATSSSSASTASARSPTASSPARTQHEGHRPVEAHPVQPRRPASSCRCASGTSRHAAASLLVRLLGLPFRLFPQGFRGLGRRHHHQDGRALDDAYRCALALRPDLRRRARRRPSTRSRSSAASAPASCST